MSSQDGVGRVHGGVILSGFDDETDARRFLKELWSAIFMVKAAFLKEKWGCTLNSTAKGVSYITAQQRSDRSSESGFSFVNSTVKGSGLVYLGRPWANYSRVVFSYTYMDKNVLPKGWDNHFDDEKNVTKLYYGEYKCFGPGSNFTERAPWVRRLTDEEAQQFISIQFILGNTWLNGPHN
ncbi:probable pectinesterase 53 [Medicago truncatula]|uniref:probable pectinesterase 53 n=1 Tax=Medicago truncatula TaxID=3880 RepID=UPI000D2F1558|nr:probable pectinesterase 53 [Medicago truncatula]